MNQPNLDQNPGPEPEDVLKRNRAMPVFITLVAIVAVGFFFWKILPLFNKSHITETTDTLRVTTSPQPFGEVFLIEDIIINPAGGSRRVFMCSIGLEVRNPESVKEIKRRQSLLRDNLITLFSSQPIEVLLDIKYRQAFRARVKKIMDYQLGQGTVERVFFEKWVFQ